MVSSCSNTSVPLFFQQVFIEHLLIKITVQSARDRGQLNLSLHPQGCHIQLPQDLKNRLIEPYPSALGNGGEIVGISGGDPGRLHGRGDDVCDHER